MKKFSLFLLLLFIASSVQLWAQKHKVTGTVIDEDGESLVGAMIEIKGTPSSQKFCDIEGKYDIEVELNQTLKFSYIGLVSQEISYNGQKVIDVTLKNEPRFAPDHPYRVYTPEQKKRDLTSAVVVRIERRTDIRAMGYTNNEQHINGAMSGMYIRPVANNSFSSMPGIRAGIGNIGGETRYTVEGVADAPYNFAEINSVTVIKNDASISAYTMATAPGGNLDVKVTEYNSKPSWLVANAWVGVQNTTSLLPYNDKDKYKSNLKSSLVQHYDVKFSDYMQSKSTIRLSGFVSYDKIQGTTDNTEGQRITPRLIFDYRPKKWAKITQNIYYDRIEQGRNWFYKGDITTQQSSSDGFDVGIIKNNTYNEIFSATTLLLNPFKWMDVKSTFSYDWIDTRGNKSDENQWYSSWRDYFDFRNQENARTNRWMWDNTISTNNYINYDHNLLFLAGFARDITELKTKAFPATDNNKWDRSRSTNNALLRGTYSYRNGVRFFTASARQMSTSLTDGSKYIYLPAVGAGWRFLEESFLDYNPGILSYVKVFANWGKTAHASVYMPVTSADRYAYPDFTYSGIKWQTTEQTEVGADLRFLNDKLSISANYYYKTTDNILENRYSPSGIMQITSGQAEIVNKGWEFAADLNGSSYRNYWSVNTNFTVNNSSVRNTPADAQLLLGNYIAPKYYYGIRGNYSIKNKITFGIWLNGAADMYIPGKAFAASFEENYARVNYFALKSVSASYDLRLYRIAPDLWVTFYVNAENLLYKTNSSLKHDAGINYSAYPVNRMFSAGMKISL